MNLIVCTPDELRALVREAVRAELAAMPTGTAADVLTRDECAKLLSLHPKVVTRYVRTRGLPAVRVGREYRFHRVDVLKWLDSQEGL
jgi:excisionase family DNA binding protein